MKRLVKVAKVLAVLALVIALGIGVFDVVLGRRLEKQMLAIKASGAPVAMTQLGEPKVPDAENGAIIYLEVIRRYTGRVLDFSKPPGPTESTPDMDVICKFSDRKERMGDPSLWVQARPAVAKYDRLIPMIEQAASRPKCQFPVRWKDGYNAALPHYPPMRGIAKLLEARALLAAKDGNMDDAVRSVELSFKVSRSLKDDPSIIGVLVRIAVLRVSCQSLREILQYGNVSEAQAKRLNSTLSQADMLPSLDRAMLGERCFGLWGFQLVRNDPTSIQDITGGPGSTRRHPVLWNALGDIWRPLSYADEAVYLRLMNEQIEMMRRPYREVFDKLNNEDRIPRYALLTRTVYPVFSRATAARDAGIAEVGGSRILLGLQAYKDRYGYYPANLKALKPQLGWEVPTDPFSGKDFIYRPKGNGFVLYSVGQNLKDDGMKPRGVPNPSLSASPRGDGYNYRNAKGERVADIIWELDH